MKILEYTEKKHTKTVFALDGGVTLTVWMVDLKLNSHQFQNNGVNLQYIEDITKYKNQNWDEHPGLLDKEKQFTELNDLLSVDINNLFYVGGHYDGKLKYHNGVPVSTIINFDDTFSQIYLKVTTLSQSGKYKNILDKCPYVSNLKIVKIPYYNAEEGQTHTITFDVLLPDEKYQGYLLGIDGMTDQIKVQIVTDILNVWLTVA